MVSKTIGLSTYIWNNNLKSTLLLVSYPFIFLCILWCIGFLLGHLFLQYDLIGNLSDVTYINQTLENAQTVILESSDDNQRFLSSVRFANSIVYNYWPSVFAIISVWFLVCYFFHSKMVRIMSHGHPVSREDEPELFNLLENLCISRGLSVPKLEVIETRARNAFASGINQSSYTITVTRGLMHTLTKDELEAVLAHELTHIMNNDVRLLIISTIFTGMLGFASQVAWNSLRYPKYRGSRNKNNAIIVIAAIALILWLGYIATIVTRFALSRRREFLADAGAITLTKKPEAMMSALIRISGKDKIPQASDDIALMCIENSKMFLGMFSTHPSIEKRLDAISKTTSTNIPSLEKGKRASDSERFLNPDNDSHPPWLSHVRKSKNPWVVTDAKM